VNAYNVTSNTSHPIKRKTLLTYGNTPQVNTLGPGKVKTPGLGRVKTLRVKTLGLPEGKTLDGMR